VELFRSGNAHEKRLKNEIVRIPNNVTENTEVGAVACKINRAGSESSKANKLSNLNHDKKMIAPGKLSKPGSLKILSCQKNCKI
jgi:hypothetical protein